MTFLSKLALLKKRLVSSVGAGLYMWRNFDSITRAFHEQKAPPQECITHGRVFEAEYVSVDGGYVLMTDGDVWPIVALYDGNGRPSSRKKATHAAVQLPDQRIAFSISSCSRKLH